MIEVWKIQKALYELYGSGSICLANAHVFCTGLEADFACITKAGYGYEFEIKRSYADFKNDFKKGDYALDVEAMAAGDYTKNIKRTKHDVITQGGGKQNYFSFCFDSKALAEKCLPEVPAKYGVIYAYETISRIYERPEDHQPPYRWASYAHVQHMRMPEKIHDNKMDWKHIAFRVGMSYKSKVFTRLKWPEVPAPRPSWMNPAAKINEV